MSQTAPTTTASASTAPSSRAHLKGVKSTNDDPDRCAICNTCTTTRHLSLDDLDIQACCGKIICRDCPALVFRHSVASCSCYGSRRKNTRQSNIIRLQKNAKKGHAWAQFYLGILLFNDGSHSAGSRWAEKAAEGGHPEAQCFFGRLLMAGEGMSIDLERARGYFERALQLDGDGHCADTCRHSLVELADIHTVERRDEVSNSILVPLAQSGFCRAQLRVGMRTLVDDKEPFAAYPMLISAVLRAEDLGDVTDAAYWAMVCCDDLNRLAKANLLLPIARRSLDYHDVQECKGRLRMMIAMKEDLRALRKECAYCCVPLDRSNRKLCKGCRTHCYCSRNCQKKHWGLGNGGHRSECKEAQSLKTQIQQAHLTEKVNQK